MVTEIDALRSRKQQLIERSDLYRQAMADELRNVQPATAWVPQTVRVARTFYPVLAMVAPLLAYVLTRKRRAPEPAPPPRRNGVIASALAGYRFFRQVKPLWDGVRSWRD